MDVTFEAVVRHGPERVLAEVGDLSGYPRWLGVVLDVAVAGDGWLVDLGARIGPFRRAKRVRMVRVAGTDGGVVGFVREEEDGEDHPAWTLDATVTPDGADGSRLVVRLRYAGSSPVIALLEPALRFEAARAPSRLAAVLDGRR